MTTRESFADGSKSRSQVVGLSLHEFCHLFAHLGGVSHDVDASSLECRNFVSGAALATSDNGTGVAHATAWRRGLSGNEADSWQVAMVVLTEPVGGFFLCLSTDLTDHNDTFGLRVIHKLSQNVNEVGTVEGISANTNDSGLTQALGGRLIDSFVGQRS